MIRLREGNSPLIVCLPHCGTDIPPVIAGRFGATGRLQTDISWHLETIMNFSEALDATVISSSISRYVIDLDRDPKLANPQSVPTDLCPLTSLDGKRIYKDDEDPGAVEIEQRVLLFHDPFHLALRQQIGRLASAHAQVIILDCQSMRSHIKGITDKGLPLANIGTRGGISCDPDLRNLFVGSFTSQQGYTVGVDELVKGGYISEAYGNPDKGVHCLTLVLAQRSYLRHETPPFERDKTRCNRLTALLEDSFLRLVSWTEIEAPKDEEQTQNLNIASKGLEEGAVPELQSEDPDPEVEEIGPLEAAQEKRHPPVEALDLELTPEALLEGLVVSDDQADDLKDDVAEETETHIKPEALIAE